MGLIVKIHIFEHDAFFGKAVVESGLRESSYSQVEMYSSRGHAGLVCTVQTSLRSLPK